MKWKINRKKIGFMVILGIITLINKESYASVYNDVTGHWCENIIATLSDEKIIESDTENFRPDDYITKAEFCEIINGLFDYDRDYVKDNEWKDKQFEIGIYNGYMPIGSPDDLLKREEACVIFERIYTNEVEQKINKDLNDFKDGFDISGWAKTSVSNLIETGKIIGYPDFTLKMKQYITRAEFTVILYRYQDLFEEFEREEERLEMSLGYLKENEIGELLFEKLDDEINLEIGDTLAIAIEMPIGYEATEVLINFYNQDGAVSLNEFTYEITAEQTGNSTIEFLTEDKKCSKKIKIIVT